MFQGRQLIGKQIDMPEAEVGPSETLPASPRVLPASGENGLNAAAPGDLARLPDQQLGTIICHIRRHHFALVLNVNTLYMRDNLKWLMDDGRKNSKSCTLSQSYNLQNCDIGTRLCLSCKNLISAGALLEMAASQGSAEDILDTLDV